MLVVRQVILAGEIVDGLVAVVVLGQLYCCLGRWGGVVLDALVGWIKLDIRIGALH